MSNELNLWRFIADRIRRNGPVMLLVVAESSGSSPGRAGYKMAIAADGELFGTIGGGAMEVRLVEQAKVKSKKAKGKTEAEIVEQVHRKDAPNSSGMICSGKQTVIVKGLTDDDLETVESVIECLKNGTAKSLEISPTTFQIVETTADNSQAYFEKSSETEFVYRERLGPKHRLFIIGGGHCALALSELISKLGFHISLFDDRPDLNTLEKNRFAHSINVIDSYETIADFVPSGEDNYVVVMTIGYKFDEIVIRSLFDKDFKYFGVLGSKAKMAVLLKTLEKEGFPADRLSRIRTPIGVPINSHTPEEIAVSIAAEIISVKNSK